MRQNANDLVIMDKLWANWKATHFCELQMEALTINSGANVKGTTLLQAKTTDVDDYFL